VKLSTVTGGDRDYLRLVPETIDECAMLVAVATSKFLPADSTLLIATPERMPWMELRVWVGLARGTQLDLATRDAIDRTA